MFVFLTPFFSLFFSLKAFKWLKTQYWTGCHLLSCLYSEQIRNNISIIYTWSYLWPPGTTFTLLFALFFVPSISSLSNLFYLFIFLHGKEVYAGSYLATYWYIRGWMYKRCVRLLPHINRYLQRKIVRTSKSDRPCTYFPVGETMRWTWNIRWEM